MYLNLRTLEAENFLSYSKLHLDFGGPGVYSVEGWNEDGSTSNGSGKSAIFDALTWGIYGMMPRYLRAHECVKFGETNGFVEVTFDDSKNNVYKIRREITPNKLKMWINNEVVPKENKMALQQYITGVVGIGYEMFNRTVYFPQGWQEKFLLMTEEYRKEALFKMIKLDKFDELYQLVSSDLKSTEHDLKLVEQKIAQQLDMVSEYTKTYASYLERSNNFDKEKQKDILSLDKEIATLDDDTKVALEKLNKIKEITKNRPQHVKECQEKLEVLRKKRDTIEELQGKREQIRSTNNKYYEEIERYKAELAAITATDKPCPYCSRPLDDSFVKAKVADTNIQISKREKIIKNNSDSITKIDQTLALHKGPILQEIDTLNQQLGEYKPQDEELSALEDSYRVLSERCSALKNVRGKKMIEVNAYVDLMKELKEKHDGLKKDILKNSDHRDNLIKQKDVLASLKQVFGPHGIKSAVIEGVLNEINSTVKDYLTILYEQSVDVKFSVQCKETPSKGVSYKVPVEFTVNGQEWAFNGLSGGEKRRAIIAVDLAISQVIARRYGDGSNLLILDEVTTDLDEHSRSKFYDLLQYLALEKSIYLVDHAIDKNSIREAKIIKVVKTNGTSTVQDPVY